jgi:hypothetical protein
MSNQNQPPIITIKFVPAGVEMVLAGLNKLPREASDGLFQEVQAQYQYQIQELIKQAEEQSKKLGDSEKAKAAAPAKKVSTAKKAVKK